MPRFVGDAIDLSNWQAPTRLVQRDDGETVLEKLPPHKSLKVVSKAGMITHVSLVNGSGRPIANDPYGNLKQVEKLDPQRGGMVPYGKCPKAIGLHEALPKPMREGSPCKMSADGHPIGNMHPCKCIVDLIALRTQANNKAEAATEARLKPRDARDAEQRDELHRKFVEHLEGGGTQKPKGKRDEA